MFLKLFDNYHAGISLLPEEEQDAFYGALARYAFEGIEPKLEGMALAVWMTIRTLIDDSLRGQENGAKGGNGRGNRSPRKTESENTSTEDPSKSGAEKGGIKPPSKTKRKEEKGIERKGKKNQKDFLTLPSDASDGAEAQGAPPDTPEKEQEREPAACPVCPMCESPVVYDLRAQKWRCTTCRDEWDEPDYKEVEK